MVGLRTHMDPNSWITSHAKDNANTRERTHIKQKQRHQSNRQTRNILLLLESTTTCHDWLWEVWNQHETLKKTNKKRWGRTRATEWSLATTRMPEWQQKSTRTGAAWCTLSRRTSVKRSFPSLTVRFLGPPATSKQKQTYTTANTIVSMTIRNS